MSKLFLEQIDERVRARYTLLYVVTWEEVRARHLLTRVAEKQKKRLVEWSITDGLRTVSGDMRDTQRERNVLKMLNTILQSSEAALYVLKDFHTYLETPEIIRQIRDLSYALKNTRKTIVFLSPTLKIPTELEKAMTIVDLPLPTEAELQNLLEEKLSGAAVSRQFRVNLNEGERDALVKAARGLTLMEAENAYARAIVRDNVLDGKDIQAVIEEKRQIIRKSGLLEYCDVEESMKHVGGMEVLKEWLRKRVRAFTPQAREYGLPAPRGMLLLGVQGCGKSLVAKGVASSWRFPLLRMDMSRIFQGYIGSSEENMRRALHMAEALAPVVLWVDEIEKALSGAEGSGSTDAGTTSRVIGQFLTWMQERSAPVFVVATANKVEGLPPELLRKGRLDEIFFVDLPRGRERAEIFHIHLKKRQRVPEEYDLHTFVRASKGFSGAEIEQAIISALHDSFFENRALQNQDVLRALQETVPLSVTMRESIAALRDWAHDRARPVTVLGQRDRTETV